MAGKLVRMLKRYRGPDGREYVKSRVYNVSRQVAECWVDRIGRAEYVDGHRTEKHHALKAFERAPSHKAHDYPMELQSNTDTRGLPKPVLKDPPPIPNRRPSPHKELPDSQVDKMDQGDLLDWLDANVKDHGYDRRFGDNTLRQAVKVEVLKKHHRMNKEKL